MFALLSGGACFLLVFLMFPVFNMRDFKINQYSYLIPKPIKEPLQNISKKPRSKICQEYHSGMGIGNMMFAFASSLGIAKSKGMDLIVKKSKLTNIFKMKVKTSDNMSECRGSKTVKPKKECAFDKNLTILFSNHSDIILKRYLQSYYYFDKYKEEIREQFVFKDDIRLKAKAIFSKILEQFNITHRKHVTLIGVHNRRGDMVNDKSLIKHGFSVATKEYLAKAVEWYQSHFYNPCFIVISNSIAWTKENMPRNISVKYLPEGNPPAVDMATVTLCDHFISTVGSYSWWSGWLTGGNVTYYKQPAKEGSKLRNCFSKDYSDYFYPNWIGF